MRRAIAALLLLVALGAGAAFAQSAKTTLTDPVLADRFNEISDRLICQCGCNMILRVCNHVNCPSGIPMRQEIERKLLAGAPDDSIVAGFVSEHGLVVLSSPPVEGVNLAAWVMPGFALLLGALGREAQARVGAGHGQRHRPRVARAHRRRNQTDVTWSWF